MSSIEIAYVGPPVMMSVAKVRETPYLMSAQVIGSPVSNVAPSRIVNAQVLPPLVAVPVSVARSGTMDVPSVASFENLYAVSVRKIVPEKNARSSPV